MVAVRSDRLGGARA